LGAKPPTRPLVSLSINTSPLHSPGIYYGFASIEGRTNVYKTAISIGYNPTYGNDEKTCEPHLISPPEDTDHRTSSSCGETQLEDFYGEVLRLSIIGHIRDELPFER
jgi:riboflavin kinase